MTLEELTLEIYAERVLTYFESKHLVVWAVNVLALGYESDNLYILAGLDNAHTEEREIYFWKSSENSITSKLFPFHRTQRRNRYSIS